MYNGLFLPQNFKYMCFCEVHRKDFRALDCATPESSEAAVTDSIGCALYESGRDQPKNFAT